jgi:superfamily I DNA/RNA helicase
MFREQIKSLPKEDRPSFDGIRGMIDKMRAWGFYGPAKETAYWETTIMLVADRYQVFGKNKNSQDMLKVFNHYIPALMRQAVVADQKIDLAEQWCAPVYKALHNHNIMIPARYCTIGYEFTNDDIDLIADVITKVPVNNLNGIVIDEAQDLSLCQLMFYLAMAYRKGEMTVIGDDKAGTPGEHGYKAGQGIYGWRGAFGGSMSLIGKLWTKLTGETVKALPLSKTHRCAPEIVDAIKPLNTVLESTRPYGDGFAYQTDINSAFSIWRRHASGWIPGSCWIICP